MTDCWAIPAYSEFRVALKFKPKPKPNREVGEQGKGGNERERGFIYFGARRACLVLDTTHTYMYLCILCICIFFAKAAKNLHRNSS